MAPFSKSKQSREPVGLDIDGRYLAAVQATAGRISTAASMELPEGLVHDGEVVDVAGLSSALKDFFRRAGLPKSVRLGVSNQQIVVRELELPRIEDEKELAAAVRFKAEEAIPMPIDEAVIDFQVTGRGTSLDGNATKQIMLVAARESMVQQLVDAARGAGLKPEGIDLDAFALVRLLGDPEDSGDRARVYCHLAGVTNVAIGVAASCVFARTLPALPPRESVEEFAGELAEQVRPSIDYYTGQPGARMVSDVLLSGPAAVAEGMADALGTLLGIPVELAAPLGTLNRVGLPPGEDPQLHTIAAGLAMGAAT